MNRRALIAAVLAAGLAPALARAAAPKRFSVRVVGKGKDVILIPGLACSGDVWDETVSRLSSTHRLHVLQVAGFAGLPAGANAEGEILPALVAEIAAYIEDEKLRQPAVIGHSIGGLLGLMLAAAQPQAVSRLMVVDALPFYSLLFGPQATVAMVKPQAAMMRDQTIAMTAEAFAAGQPATLANMVKSPAGRERALRWSLASDKSVVARAMYEDMITDIRPALSAIKAPVTVLYAFDPAMPLPAAGLDALYGQAYAALPNKTLVRVDGAYHFIMYDQPQAFAAKVDAFLA